MSIVSQNTIYRMELNIVVDLDHREKELMREAGNLNREDGNVLLEEFIHFSIKKDYKLWLEERIRVNKA